MHGAYYRWEKRRKPPEPKPYLEAKKGDVVLVLGSPTLPDGWYPVLEVREDGPCRVYVPLILGYELEPTLETPHRLGDPWGVANDAIWQVYATRRRVGPGVPGWKLRDE